MTAVVDLRQISTMKRRGIARHLLPPLVLGSLFAAMLAVTWKSWPDPLVDFGRELYVAWRLSEGAVLYRDVAHLNGPISAYFNSLLFRLFGTGLTTIIFGNLLVLVGVTIALYRLVSVMSDRFAATVAVAVFLSVFGFGSVLESGNYNFICPYSHELTHGFLLALLTLMAAVRWTTTARSGWLFCASLLAGTSLLTKPETALASSVTLGMVAMSAVYGRIATPLRRLAPTMLFGIALPPVLAWALLAIPLGPLVSAEHLLSPWQSVLNRSVHDLLFYQVMAGFDDPSAHALTIATWVALYFLVSGAIWGLSKALKRYNQPLDTVPAALIGLLTLALMVPPGRVMMALTPLPVLSVGVAVASLACRDEDRKRGAVTLGLAVVSLALVLKVLLAVRPNHYGFVLAVPGTALLVVLLVHWLPLLVARSGGSVPIARGLALSLVLFWTAVHTGLELQAVTRKTTLVGRANDSFRAAGTRAKMLNEAMSYAVHSFPGLDQATVAVLPEGAMVNYLLRRPSSSPFVTLMPPEVLIYSEDTILKSFENHPPDLVFLIHKDTSEYGLPLFGRDYGTSLMSWVRRTYTRRALIGDEPFEHVSRRGIEILTRRSPASLSPRPMQERLLHFSSSFAGHTCDSQGW